MRRAPLAIGILLVLGACGGETARMRPLPVPGDGPTRDAAMRAYGRELYRTLSAGEPDRLLADDVELRSLLTSEAASRYTALRMGSGMRLDARPEQFVPFQQASYGGLCLQGSRLEPKSSPLGLRADGWVFDRALVIGVQPSGRRIAAWVEGTFVYTPEGFVALELSRVEAPRWEHSDLELAPCDMEVGGPPRP